MSADRTGVTHGFLSPLLLTCESVLSEASFYLGSSESVLEFVADGLLEVAFDCSNEIAALSELGARFQDRRPDFADLCLIRMSERYPPHSVITVDEAGFRVYRRNKRDVIPLICPPRR